MKKILTKDEKKYLRRVSNYLLSLGMDNGNIEIHSDSGYSDFPEDTNIDEWTSFSNNHRAEIPEGLRPILKKIVDYVSQYDIQVDVDEDVINYQTFEININVENKEITVMHYWYYYDKGESITTEYEGEEGAEIFDEWEKKNVFNDLQIPEDGILTIRYNGSGDSGYIEDSFSEITESVPAEVETWAYDQLESSFGGWEINEGSEGEFVLDFNEKTILHYHTENSEMNGSDTLYEEEF